MTATDDDSGQWWTVRDLTTPQPVRFDRPDQVVTWLHGLPHSLRGVTVVYPGGTPKVDAVKWLAHYDPPGKAGPCKYCRSLRLVPRGPVQAQHTNEPWRRYRCADCMAEMDIKVAR